MYARHTTVFPHPDKMQAVADLLRDDAIPFYQKQPGYRGFVVLVRDQDLVGINLWESEAAWIAVRGSDAQAQQKDHFVAITQGFFRQGPVVLFYDVPVAVLADRDMTG